MDFFDLSIPPYSLATPIYGGAHHFIPLANVGPLIYEIDNSGSVHNFLGF